MGMEPHFYKKLLDVLFDGQVPRDLPQQYDSNAWPWMHARFAAIFASRPRDEWAKAFHGIDACAVPILTAQEAARHPHNVLRKSFSPSPGRDGLFEPNPAPKLSRTPGLEPRLGPKPGEHTLQVLTESGFDSGSVSALLNSGAAVDTGRRSKL